jgi:glycosyltransferase involved in cell wall biosynthesis
MTPAAPLLGETRAAAAAGRLGGSDPRTGPLREAAAKGRAGRPRLLILTVGFGVGGVEQLILSTAPLLQKEGFEVTVACLKGWDILGDELDARGVRAVALGARGRLDFRAAGRLLTLLRSSRIQILHAHLFLANQVARFLGRLAGVPVIITSHHDIDLWMGLRHRLIERVTAPWSDAVVACSEAVRRHAVETFGLRRGLVHTLHNGIEIGEDRPLDPERRRLLRRELGAGPEDLLLGCVGRLVEPKKGLAVLLAAVGRIARAVPGARLAIVGDGPARSFLERRAVQEGVRGRTVFAGLRRDVDALMSAFDLFVLPSNWEGFGIALLEAMAATVPVVATRVGGVPEVVLDGETGLLVPPGDPEALAAACIDLLGDRERAARLAAAGRRRVETEFGAASVVERMAALYRDLLGRNRPGAVPAPGRDRGRARGMP